MSAPEESDARRPNDRLSAGGASLSGFAIVALVNAIYIEVAVPRPSAGFVVRAGHHLYDAGHLLALGLVSLALVAAWQRFRPRFLSHGFFSAVLIGGAAIGVGYATLVSDLDNLASRLSIMLHKGDPWPTILLNVLIVAVSLGIPIAWGIAWLFARPKLRWVAVALGMAAAIVNQRILRNDYEGAHLFLGWAAAVFAGVPLAGVARSPRLPRGARLLAALALVAVPSFATVAIRPGTNVLLQLYTTQGSVLAPFLARLRGRVVPEHLTAAIPKGQAAWFRDRSAEPPVPPTPPRANEAPVVILVGIDSVRADVLEDPKYLAQLPELTKLKAESVYFSEARSAGPGTVFSYTATFAGRYFSEMYWSERHGTGIWAWEDPSPRFPEILRAHGVTTVDFASILWFVNDWGVARGFGEETNMDPRTSGSHATAAELVGALTARLGKQGDGPAFYFVHFMDAHYPYDRGRADGTPKDRFVSELAIVDEQLGKLRRVISHLPIADRTTLVVTADHGEAFGEHGTTQHGTTLYEELLRVPLFIKSPDAKPRVVTDPVSLIDLGPTVLDLLSVDTPGNYMGQSLVPFLRGASPVLTRPIVAEGRLKRSLVFADGMKVITDERRGTVELYDLVNDPAELHNLAAEGSAEAEPRVGAIDAFFQVHTLKRKGYSPPFRP